MIPDYTTALHADGFKVENDGASWESWDPAGDAGASPDDADALRETVPGSPSDESSTPKATDLVIDIDIDIDCTAGELRTLCA